MGLLLCFLLFAGGMAVVGKSRSSGTDPKLGLIRPLQDMIADPSPSPKKLRAGARYARLIGYSQAGQALSERADFVELVRRAIEVIGERLPAQHEPAAEPAAESESGRQDNLLLLLAALKMTDTERRGRDWLLGLWGLSPRVLGQLALMKDVKREGDRWVGTWAGAMPVERWLASPTAQAQVVTALLRLHRETDRDTLESMVGQEIEGQEATLSGLLAVALRAGSVGLKSWLADEGERAKFKTTTAAYQRANGIF